MGMAVRNLGHEVECVASGIECLEALCARDFDIVLLDFIMPCMDGFEVLEAIKADPALCEVPVIVISSLEEVDDSVRAIELGAEDSLTKPFNPVLLKARLGAGIERKRLRDKELEYLRQVDRRPTYPCDDENARCSDLGACEDCRNSLQVTFPSTTTPIRNATFQPGQLSGSNSTQLSLSDAVSARYRGSVRPVRPAVAASRTSGDSGPGSRPRAV